MVSIIFLGTSGSVVTKRRMCAGILYEDRLLDAGFGVLTNLLRLGKNPSAINSVYITHTHSDHIGDFTGLVWAMAMEQRTNPLKVVCSKLTSQRLKRILLLQSTPAAFVKFPIKFLTPKEDRIEHLRTVHDPENIAFRFKTKAGDFVYTGDTSKYFEVAKFAKNAKLLIHDGTYIGGQESMAKLTNHSTAREAGEIAGDAGVRHLVLTHISPANEGKDSRYISEMRQVFEGKMSVAKDFLMVKLRA